MEINASVSFPLNVDNFYGLGNDTKKINKKTKNIIELGIAMHGLILC
jgi:hypothetical protein